MDNNRLGTQKIPSLLLSMSLPIVMSMLIQALYNVVDSIFVAMINEQTLTAVSMFFPVQNFIIALASGTSVGVNALLSRNLGAKNYSRANSIARHGFFLSFCSYLLFLLIGIFGSRTFFAIQASDPVIISYGIDYMRICCIFSFGVFFQILQERLLQATGKPVYSMIVQGLGAIINIILDPILIFGLLGLPALGVAGAAYATVLGQIIAGIVGIILNIRVNHDIKINMKGFKPNLDIIKNIYSIGFPSIIMISITSITTFFINKILAGFSYTAVAAFGIYYKVQSFIFMPVFGINNGLIPIVGYNFGAKNEERILHALKLAVFGAVGIMLIGFTAFQVFPVPILKMFNASDDLLSIGVPALRIISISFIFAGYSIVGSSFFQALGNGVLSMIVSIVRQIIFLIPSFYILSLTGNVNRVWWSYPIAEIASVIMVTIFIRKIITDKVEPLTGNNV